MSKDDAGRGGYGRPPHDSRFKPGRSGNPAGRPKGVRTLRSDFNEVMKKRVQIREDGELRYISRQEALLLSLCVKALQGDTRASGQLLARWAKTELRDTQPSQSNVTTNDHVVVEDFLRRNNEAASAVRGTTSTECQAAVDPSNNDDTTGIAGDQKGAKQ
jgi:hypothetical protein